MEKTCYICGDWFLQLEYCELCEDCKRRNCEFCEIKNSCKELNK